MRQTIGPFRQQLGIAMKTVALLKRDGISAVTTAIRTAARKRSPKDLAFDLELSDEGVRKIRDGERPNPGLSTVLAFMAADPEVAAIVEAYARRCQQPDFWDYDLAEKNQRNGR